MRENNFEKQVRQKMDELRLNPPDELWQKVSMAITKRKSGRRLSAILFLFLLLISSGVFITWHQINNSKINNNIVEKRITEKANAIAPGNMDINSRQIIDSPGFEQFGMAQFSLSQVQHAMPEFVPYLGSCKFHNCTHEHEPQCAILAALEQGIISEKRHNFYLRLIEQLKYYDRALY